MLSRYWVIPWVSNFSNKKKVFSFIGFSVSYCIFTGPVFGAQRPTTMVKVQGHQGDKRSHELFLDCHHCRHSSWTNINRVKPHNPCGAELGNFVCCISKPFLQPPELLHLRSLTSFSLQAVAQTLPFTCDISPL